MNKIHKMEVTMDKVEAAAYKKKREVRRAVRSVKAKALAILIGIGLSGVVMGFAFYNISQWYDKNRVVFQTPVQIRPPVIIKARVVPTASKSATIASTVIVDQYLPIINELYRKVRFMESTAGMNAKDQTATHNYCQSIGKVNEIGYLVDGDRRFCFADYGEQWLTFKRWFEKRLPTMSKDEALCAWNTGTKQPMCNYSMKYNSL